MRVSPALATEQGFAVTVSNVKLRRRMTKSHGRLPCERPYICPPVSCPLALSGAENNNEACGYDGGDVST